MKRTRREDRASPRSIDDDIGSPAPDPTLRALIESAIFELLSARRDDSTICPSEVARALASDADGWRALMSPIRSVAQDLAQDQRLRVTRRGEEVNATTGGGPIRLGRPRRPADT